MLLPVARVGALARDATAVAVNGEALDVDSLQILAPARAISLLGLPALAIPAGLDDAGMPVGVQLVGAAGAEHSLVAVATAARVTSFRRRARARRRPRHVNRAPSGGRRLVRSGGLARSPAWSAWT